jgi:hypothetical protein
MRRLSLALGMLCLAGAVHAAPGFVFSPYKHLAQGRGDGHVIHTADGAPYATAGGQGALTWAFANGECGSEKWGDQSADDVARANVAAFDAARIGYIVSTGGQGGLFTCGSDEGMGRFLTRYASAHFIGVDFDIEENQTAAQVEELVRHVKAAQAKWPTLRWSFTVATFAASDGSRRGLNATGEVVVAAIRKAGLQDAVLNLMVMDYGAADVKACVVKEGRCDMGASALQAVRNVHEKYGWPYAQIEVTPMPGMNDVAANDFTLADAAVVADAVRAMGLAGLHYWSLDRDRPCAAPQAAASPLCSGVEAPPGAYRQEFARAAR